MSIASTSNSGFEFSASGRNFLQQLSDRQRELLAESAPCLAVLATIMSLMASGGLSALLCYRVLPAPVPLVGPILVLALSLGNLGLAVWTHTTTQRFARSLESRLWIMRARDRSR